jgi:hypothetical protein
LSGNNPPNEKHDLLDKLDYEIQHIASVLDAYGRHYAPIATGVHVLSRVGRSLYVDGSLTCKPRLNSYNDLFLNILWDNKGVTFTKKMLKEKMGGLAIRDFHDTLADMNITSEMKAWFFDVDKTTVRLRATHHSSDAP